MTTTTSEYQQQAIDFLESTGSKLTIEYDRFGCMPWDKDGQMRNIFDCVLSKDGETYSFEFGTSILDSCKQIAPNNYSKFIQADEIKPPSEYDILASLSVDYSDDLEEFVANFGYEFNTVAEFREVERTFEAVKEQSDALVEMYTEEELELLHEIA